MSTGESYRFGPFRLDRAAYRLTRGDEVIALSPKVLDLLFLFVSRPETLVTKDDILQALWPDVAVTDNAITQVVSELRQALGDRAASPAWVQTVPRRGYRFIGAVAAEPGAAARPRTAEPAAAAAGPRTIAVLELVNVTGEPDAAWLGRGLAETITNDLRVIRDLRVLDRAVLALSDQPGAGLEAVRDAGADLVVVGSFQQAGDRLRITARVIDVRTGEALVHAKADGALASIFGLQDAVVQQLIEGLRLNITPAAAARLGTHETSSLEAYQALTEGRLRLEALDPAEIPPAIACFERALALDPAYAYAHVGLAHARFWRFQASRARARPETGELRAAVAHAERAVAIDPALAEAHAALAFFLSAADRPVEALAAGRRAVAIEPGNWRHEFRLGIAAWGEERLDALGAVVAHFPQLAYAYFALAMVYVARSDFDSTERVLRDGLAAAPTSAAGRARFPASGLYWLLGCLRLARGESAAAEAAFERELETPGSRLFEDEYHMSGCAALGFTRLAGGDAASAIAWFERALAGYPHHARSLAGLGAARAAAGDRAAAGAAWDRARTAIADLAGQGRAADAAIASATLHAAAGDVARAAAELESLVETAPPGPAGWSIPVEPGLVAMRGDEAFHRVLTRLAARAR